MAENQVEFITLTADDRFEISTQEPWIVRRKEDGFIPKFCKTNSGYLIGWVGDQTYTLHRLVAEQFVENDDPINKTQIDHIDQNRLNNSIANLRWVNNSQNCKNKSKHNNEIVYEYVDEVPNDAIVINDYGKHRFEFYYFSEETDKFYYYNGLRYRVLHTNELKRNGAQFVYVYDTNNNKTKICINKFKRLYNLIN